MTKRQKDRQRDMVGKILNEQKQQQQMARQRVTVINFFISHTNVQNMWDSGSHSDKYEDDNLLRHRAMESH